MRRQRHWSQNRYATGKSYGFVRRASAHMHKIRQSQFQSNRCMRRSQSSQDFTCPPKMDVGHFLEVLREEKYSEHDKSGSEFDPDELEADYDSPDEEPDPEFESTSKDTMETSEYYLGRDRLTKWYKKPFPNPKIKSEHPIISGPTTTTPITSEIEAFYQIIDKEMIKMITEFSNIHITEQRHHHNRERDALNTSESEISSILGMLYIMGSMKAKDTNVMELWANDGTGIEIFRACMSYKRLLFLLKCLQFDDRNTREDRLKTDNLADIRPILEIFVDNCKSAYSPDELLTFGEILSPFRGKCVFNRYVPNKAARYGMKLNALCDSKTGYVSNLEVCCGTQSSEESYFVSNHPKDVVERLVGHLEGSGRSVTAEKLSEAYQISTMLLEKGITFTGTLKNKQKEIPFSFFRNNTTGNDLYGFQKDCLLLSHVPESNKTILLLSSKITEPSTEKGRSKALLHYEYTVNDVNSIDDLCSTYTTARRSRNWAHCLFYTLLNIAGINAHIIYSSNPSNKKLELKQFLKNLGISLMNERLRERAQMKFLPNDISHFLQKYKVQEPEDVDMEMEARRGRKRGRCKPCGRNKDNNTTMKCGKCLSFICRRHSNLLCSGCYAGLEKASANTDFE